MEHNITWCSLSSLTALSSTAVVPLYNIVLLIIILLIRKALPREKKTLFNTLTVVLILVL